MTVSIMPVQAIIVATVHLRLSRKLRSMSIFKFNISSLRVFVSTLVASVSFSKTAILNKLHVKIGIKIKSIALFCHPPIHYLNIFEYFSLCEAIPRHIIALLLMHLLRGCGNAAQGQ